jgi:hypothetical protein
MSLSVWNQSRITLIAGSVWYSLALVSWRGVHCSIRSKKCTEEEKQTSKSIGKVLSQG